jgi:hypothetical protein
MEKKFRFICNFIEKQQSLMATKKTATKAAAKAPVKAAAKAPVKEIAKGAVKVQSAARAPAKTPAKKTVAKAPAEARGKKSPTLEETSADTSVTELPEEPLPKKRDREETKEEAPPQPAVRKMPVPAGLEGRAMPLSKTECDVFTLMEEFERDSFEFVWVKSAENPADRPSRAEDVKEEDALQCLNPFVSLQSVTRLQDAVEPQCAAVPRGTTRQLPPMTSTTSAVSCPRLGARKDQVRDPTPQSTTS